jgi:hypothetical protein
MTRSIGFLCDLSTIFLNIDDEVVVIKFCNNNNNKKIIDIDVKSKYSQYSNECKEMKEVEADVEELYSAKYYPRTYYTIYRVVIQQPKIKLYLMEKFNGTTGLIMFFYCRTFRNCITKIDKFEKN